MFAVRVACGASVMTCGRRFVVVIEVVVVLCFCWW